MKKLFFILPCLLFLFCLTSKAQSSNPTYIRGCGQLGGGLKTMLYIKCPFCCVNDYSQHTCDPNCTPPYTSGSCPTCATINEETGIRVVNGENVPYVYYTIVLHSTSETFVVSSYNLTTDTDGGILIELIY